MKMKLLDPEIKNIQSIIQRLKISVDYQAIINTQSGFKALKEKHNVSSMMTFLNLTQVTKHE